MQIYYVANPLKSLTFLKDKEKRFYKDLVQSNLNKFMYRGCNSKKNHYIYYRSFISSSPI